MHPYLNIAIKAVNRAGHIAANKVENSNNIDTPQRILEDIKETINRSYSRHSFYDSISNSISDKDSDNVTGEVKWLIDPMDGFVNFLHKDTNSAIVIAIENKGKIEHAVIYNPLQQEIFTASKGEGASLNSKRVRASMCNKLDLALVATQNVDLITDLKINKNHNLRVTGCSALDFANVAAGRYDAAIAKDLSLPVYSAINLFLKESGAFINEFEAKKIIGAARKIYPTVVSSIL